MRKLFAATFGISAMLSLIVGVAFAWTANTGTKIGSADVGQLSVDVANVAGTSNDLYPTGASTRVLTGQIRNNTANNPGINVLVDGANPGTATVTGYEGGLGECTTTTTGNVVRTSDAQASPGGGVGGGWAIDLTMEPGADNGCQGATAWFDYTINVTTP